MKNRSAGKYFAFAVLGFALLAGGALFAHATRETADGILKTLPYICIGIGSGVFGANLGTAVNILALRKDPRAAKRAEIETNDERNVSIRNRAKARAYDIMVYVFGALTLGFALMETAMYVILAVVAAYLIVIGAHVYYLAKFSKEM
ncbi:hypothetical protein SAMN02745823_02396 [Sporobacter termitidis DSM 10068]|uniref:DUF2178 domain-containing protein n=1 Tax=Sporobacter termitidis DSM 10068 TaxID=1123282 RepID=A0A1M5YEM2_9FIRM|nr:hypothetical protein [Sporobacter termitidis]SHI09973.1 hypothetical protein SAMN02745823_02396 [Sporobacter termitidis DSM 10068]